MSSKRVLPVCNTGVKLTFGPRAGEERIGWAKELNHDLSRLTRQGR